jgi:glucose-1-phosphate cytidylyltransferase
MKAVILAGGLGTRIAEETNIKPKPMVEIGGKPILWHIMKTYSHYGINDFVICCGYKGYVIKEYFANYFLHMSDVTFDLQHNKMDVHQRYGDPWRVTLVDTGEDTMTGGRLRRVAPYLQGEEAFCFTYGDGVCNLDIAKLIEFHSAHGLAATITATYPPGRFGAIDIRQDHTVTSFIEKPKGGSQWRQRVGTVIQHREKFQETIDQAGLILIGEVRHDGDGNSGKLVAKVRCPTGHEFDVRMDELSLLLRNKYVSDRTIVPHVCEACCYPGMIGIARKATVFHRLAYLGHRLPNVRYVSGFDGTGKGMEEFNCGERLESTGDPHPNFFHRWHTALQTNVEDFRTPCLVCACKRGESLPAGAKTLEMIEGRMKLIDEALAEIVGRELYAPSVSLVPHGPGGTLVEGRFINTTKTELTFSCGAPGHPSIISLYDKYFSVHRSGYCRFCLREAGLSTTRELFPVRKATDRRK